MAISVLHDFVSNTPLKKVIQVIVLFSLKGKLKLKCSVFCLEFKNLTQYLNNNNYKDQSSC